VTRAFVAIQPPPFVLDAVDERVAAVAMPGARRTSREQWHLTLQFLGDDADIYAVAAALQREPFDVRCGDLQLGGAVALGDRRRARILALTLLVGTDWMRELATHVEERLAPLGYTRGRDETFVPHLTLARFRVRTDLVPLCAAIGSDPVGPGWTTFDFALFESVLRADGAQHLARVRLPLGR
jgi:2'-5' RNA ligase